MRTNLIRGLRIVVACLPLLYLGYCATHMPGGVDMDAASQVARIIDEGFGRFDDRQLVERTGKGKTWYVAPAVGPSPIFSIYEITQPQDIAAIECLANLALVKVPTVKAITLKFHERQNLTVYESGGASRGWEHAFLTKTISRNAQVSQHLVEPTCSVPSMNMNEVKHVY